MTQVLFFTTKSVYHLGKVFLSCFSTNHEEAILLVSITINTPFNDIANTEKMFLLSPPVHRTSFNDLFLHSHFNIQNWFELRPFWPFLKCTSRVMNFDGALKVFWTSSPISIFFGAALRTPRRRMLCSTFSFKIPPTLFRKRREYWFSLPLFPRHFHRAITRQQCDNQTKLSKYPKNCLLY